MTKFIGAALFTMLLLVSCSSSDTTNGDPNVVLQDFFTHLSKKDIDGASKYVTSDSKMVLQMMEKGMALSEKLTDSLAPKDFSKQLEDIVTEPARISGDSAYIIVRNKNEEKWNAEFLLIKQNGWKVDFSLKTLTQMGKAKAEMEGIHDSLDMSSEDLQKGLKMADSVLKNLDPKMIEQIQKQLEGLK